MTRAELAAIRLSKLAWAASDITEETLKQIQSQVSSEFPDVDVERVLEEMALWTVARSRGSNQA